MIECITRRVEFYASNDEVVLMLEHGLDVEQLGFTIDNARELLEQLQAAIDSAEED